jgi:hypothetical protein
MAVKSFVYVKEVPYSELPDTLGTGSEVVGLALFSGFAPASQIQLRPATAEDVPDESVAVHDVPGSGALDAVLPTPPSNPTE